MGARKIGKETRFFIWVGQDFRCHYCKEVIPLERVTMDHKVPRSVGGEQGINLVAACQPCNSAKSDKPYEEFVKSLQPKEEHEPYC